MITKSSLDSENNGIPQTICLYDQYFSVSALGAFLAYIQRSLCLLKYFIKIFATLSVFKKKHFFGSSVKSLYGIS